VPLLAIVPSPDRRQAVRQPCYVGATLRTSAAGDPTRGDAILSYAVDLSERGALLRTLRSLPAGLRVEVALTPRLGAPGARQVTVCGQVVRSSAPLARGDTCDLGIRFDAPVDLAGLLAR